MSHRQTNSDNLERFLNLLGVEYRQPGIEALTELVTAFMTRVPFENISKLYYFKRDGLRTLPDTERYLEGIERNNFGGTCYPNNYHLNQLLCHLGYNAALCGAGMADPDVHLVNLVYVEDREFLVDAGYAAPFLKPLPRDLKQDYVVEMGRDRYVLRPQSSDGYSRLDLFRDGELKHGYTVNPTPRTIEHFAHVIEDSFTDSSVFMKSILIVRLYPNRSIVIHNLSVIESEGTDYQIQPLESRDELPAVAEEPFSIPGTIVSEAIAGLGDLGDPWN